MIDSPTAPFWQRLFARKAMVVALIVVLGSVIYSFMLGGSFKTVDDEVSIVFNPFIRDWSGLPHLFTSSFFGQGSFYRPLVSVSFMVDYAIGGLDPLIYHVSNLIIHVLNAVLVFYAVDRIMQSRNISAWTAILFVMHPIQWEAVSNIAGRSVLLSTLFSLIAWIVYMHWDKRGGAHWLVLIFGAQIAALLSKESAVMLPVLLLWTTLFYGPRHQHWIKRCLKTTPFFLVVVLYLMLRQGLGIMHLGSWLSWQEHIFSIITFLNGLLRYIGIFVFPVDLHFYRTQWIFSSWAQPALWGTLLVWMVMLVSLWRSRRQWCDRVWFVLGFIVIEIALIAQVLTPLSTQPGVISLAEHLFYMPSIPILMFLVMCVRLVGNRYLIKKENTRRLYPLVVGIFLLFYASTAAFYARHASNELTMLKRAVAYEPWHNRNHFSLGLIYAKLQRFDQAEDHFRRALAFHPLDPRAAIGLARALVDQGRVDEGLMIYNNMRYVPPDLIALWRQHVEYAETVLKE